MTPARLQQTDANALSVDDGPEPAAERSVHVPIDTGPLAAEDEDTVSTTLVDRRCHRESTAEHPLHLAHVDRYRSPGSVTRTLDRALSRRENIVGWDIIHADAATVYHQLYRQELRLIDRARPVDPMAPIADALFISSCY